MAGSAAAPLLADWFGVAVPWWAVAAGCWLVVALVGFVRVEVAGALLAVLVLAELAVLTGFAAANLLHPAGGITWETLRPTVVERPTVGLLLVVAAGAYIGVETVAAYGEEARGPRRALTRATYAAVAVAALVYTAGAWAMSVAVGPGRIAAAAADRGPELMFDLAGARLAPWAVTLGQVLLLTGLLAAMISLHHTIARYLFALGREHLLPGWLARTAPRTSVPRAASLTQSLVAAGAIGACVALHADPTGWLVRRLTVVGAMGVLVLLVLSSLAALIHLNRVPGAENVWQRFLAPVLSTVGLGTLACLTYVNVPDLPPVLIVLGTLFIVGALFGVSLRRKHPVEYAGIGLGGVAVVVTPAIPQQRALRAPGAHRPERINR
jgi:amino acid transporter